MKQPSSTMSTNLNPRHVDGYLSLKRNDHGWVEYSLPGETPYYVHPGRQVTTDVNLRDGRLLKAVMTHLGDRNVAAPGRELWLRNTGEGEREWWVDHQRQLVTLPEASGEGDARYYAQRGNEEVNRLDARYRYWSFMEVHPAHAPLPPSAQTEATDILTWASSALLLRLPRSASALFTQDECQEFITLLRSPGMRYPILIGMIL
ncbi:hypothetical protein BD779DRAFT_744577 [Infundibulicybe gibba]|nr:hypothetical protein BD779DRAFT_744577 [Infundibulicybe gibba]